MNHRTIHFAYFLTIFILTIVFAFVGVDLVINGGHPSQGGEEKIQPSKIDTPIKK
jgi:hypothetical protein